MTIAVNAAKKQRGRPFPKGRSGNPTGKPLGARNRATLAAEALLDGESQALTRKAVEMALEGDATALRLCLERILPPRRDRPIQFRLPRLANAADALAAIEAISAGLAGGDLSESEARALILLIDSFRETLAAVDYETRLRAIERQVLARPS